MTIMTTSRTKRFGISRKSQSGVQLVSFPDLFNGSLRNGICPWNTLNRLTYLLKSQEFDLIHAFDSRPNVIVPALCGKKRFRIPLIMDWADWWGRGGTTEERSGHLFARSFGRVEQFFEEYFRQFANYSTVICTALKQRLEGLGYDGDRISVIPQGCKVEDIKPVPIEICRKRLSLDRELSIIGHLGTLFNRDAKLLFEAMKHVNGLKPNAKLLLIGRHKLNLSAFATLVLNTL